MKLLPLSADQLLAHSSLPFSVYTQDGVKLLSAHATLDDPLVRDQLRRLHTVYACRSEYEGWLHSPDREWESLLHGQALPSLLAHAPSRAAQRNRPATLEEEWEQVIVLLDHVMQHPDTDHAWLAHVLEIHARVRALSAHRLDEALFHLLFTGSSRYSFYSSRQALRCMLIAGEAARALEWEEARVAQLEKAALTMNVTVWRLQDQLTQYPGGIESAEDRARIEHHPADGARLLMDHGVTETVWLEAVWLHHDAGLAARPLASLAPGQQAGLLLHRVDSYSAMLSRRARSQPLSALQVAQQACLGPDGLPDPLGSVLLKAIGLYPPGTFVALASNESGVVLERGEHANTPVVAALTNRDGMVMSEPRLRYTSHKESAVRTALPYGKVLVDPPLDKLRALRTFLHSP
ncbi:hypothetical protein [uncultured Azohydromonas sp.]|mgnify:CR=1 FL=1|jgi:HD-GYP domain|uniref:hypothetical protein n=1 Tax=uncultured Azohydromonas sp. TaxID=487342 RepID=UPI0026242153|nr:hypothetical protein [uncultured Azohydromonas sp.]